MTWRKSFLLLLIAAALLSLAFHRTLRASASNMKQASGEKVSVKLMRDDATAASAFEAMIPVLHHPRCMNCHSTGDFPRQGDDSHRHTMQVQRGPHGHGINAVK